MTDIATRCPVCGGGTIMRGGVWGDFPHDHKPDLSGLDDGPFLPGHAPRRKPASKSAEEMRDIRARAWATRKAKRDRHSGQPRSAHPIPDREDRT